MPKKEKSGSAASSDPDDAPPLTDAFFDRAEIRHGDKIIRRGRPPLPNPKRAVKLRLDADVLAAYRATGDGWQTRINADLRNLRKLKAGTSRRLLISRVTRSANLPQRASGRMQTLLPIDDRIDRAVQLVLRARIFFELWFYFEGRQTRPTILNTMREYNEFFRFMPHAHQVAFFVTIATLFDKRTDTISLRRLAQELRRKDQLSQQTQAEVDELLREAEPLVSKIILLRHKAFAHRSAYTSYDDAFKEAKVTPNQMRNLTEVALQIANKLAEARGMYIGFFNELPQQDAARMMRTLMKLVGRISAA
jgi:uncharacterized protein (DUF4415 family)